MKTSDIPPFAITARACYTPAKLYTPLLVANIDKLKSARVNAMWDTGSPWCMMSRRLFDLLGFEFQRTNPLRGISGNTDANCGFAYVSLLSGGGLICVQTAVVDDFIGGDLYSFIIGLNLIKHGTLAISSTPLETVLSFKVPASIPPIDFTASGDGDEDAKAIVPLSLGKEIIQEFDPVKTVGLLKSLYPHADV